MEKSGKTRTIISIQMLKIVRDQIINGRINMEIAESNSISLNCGTKRADKISFDLSDDDFISEERKKTFIKY